MPTIRNSYERPKPSAQLVEVQDNNLGSQYRIVEGERVYAEKITRSGAKPKLGEAYKLVYR